MVALERSREAGNGSAPTPTVDVLARLAQALAMDARDLFAAALRPAGRHTLLVVEDHERSPLDHARAAAPTVGTWVWAGTSRALTTASARGNHSINLRRNANEAYEPAVIAASLRHELQALGSELGGRQVGLVFADTSAVMSTLDDPGTIISFEHSWGHVVSRATASIGAHAACNVCVYELSALRALPDPVGATLDLIRSHDSIWSARHTTVTRAGPGARRILEQLRPSGIAATEWRTTVGRLIDDLAIAA
ncbi:unannotated protein [freshwater metagenome]|uniref:Unannotated protein n=1 Tax=freshwater metagenome TaxID=449393 RepID=A0A6J7EEP9_9ZZZZ